MTVYVDNFFQGWRRKHMCHMVADSREELDAMADLIGLHRRWIQHAGTPKEHYDVSRAKRQLAIQHGAQEITVQQLGAMILQRRQREDAHGTIRLENRSAGGGVDQTD